MLSSQSPGPSVLHQPRLFIGKTEESGPHPRESQARRPTVGVKRTCILNLCHKHGSSETLQTTCPRPHLGDHCRGSFPQDPRSSSPVTTSRKPQRRQFQWDTRSHTRPGPQPLPAGSCLPLLSKDKHPVLALHCPGACGRRGGGDGLQAPRPEPQEASQPQPVSADPSLLRAPRLDRGTRG